MRVAGGASRYSIGRMALLVLLALEPLPGDGEPASGLRSSEREVQTAPNFSQAHGPAMRNVDLPPLLLTDRDLPPFHR